VFLDRDGVVNRDTHWISRPEELDVYPFAGLAIGRLRDNGWLTVLVTNQSAVARGLCSLDDVERIHEELQARLGADGARLDAIYVCPHHPEFGARVECSCRKPGTGLIDRAVTDLGIERAESYLVGDKTTDILAGQRAGLRTILVRTGEAGADGLASVTPDWVDNTLEEAVDRILGSPGELLT